ncbi:hypothetical protein B0T10DRAFT_31330 [Thelonectria olida]|uniref:Siderophore biosynthesis n=1 Tax=Thelonectria olida TaxID=1576542 RepID=A0A9P8WLC2_9HYPO|nr:hypothetical protein B0T10DRAFT_31330 [Thelonectria olida]
MRVTAAALLLAAAPALARTDLEGCTSSDGVYSPSGGTPYATRIWYVPDTGEICEFLDCGGGRAPPKTTVPGCPLYEGTATYSPSYLDMAASTTAAAVKSTTTQADEDESATITEAATTDEETATHRTTLSTKVAESESDEDTTVAAATTGTPVSAITTPSAGSHSGSGSGSNSTATGTESGSSSAETTSSTGGAASMPTAGALMGLMAGAAVYAGLL